MCVDADEEAHSFRPVQAETPDLVGVVEALYATDLRSDVWLRVVAERMRPFVDRYHQGIAGMLYSCPDPCSFTPTQALFCDVSDALHAAFFEGMQTFSSIFVADSFLSKSCFMAASTRGWKEIGIVRDGSGPARGFTDGINLNAVEPDGAGCWFGSARPEVSPIPDDLYLALTRLARHLAAAHRLRRKHPDAHVSPDAAEAILDARGRVQHATGEARDDNARTALLRAAHSMDQARRRLPGSDPSEAIKDWKSIVSKRWTLLEHFDRDSKRFTLAVDNRTLPPSVDLLSKRELQVAVQAAAGSPTKRIARELGLSASTVRVLLSRAMTKMGARTRAELVERFARVRSGGAQRGDR
jgi:DNA-binding CsgD family transcriptional regulator